MAPSKAAKFPISRTKNAEEGKEDEAISLPSAPSADSLPLCRTGYTGLGNLGNTCYMNAVLQALANTTPLKNYFLGTRFSFISGSLAIALLIRSANTFITDKQFQTEINRENPLGFGGSLAIAFAVILRQLWSGQRDSIEPSHLKNLLANRASQFSGYAQHDAQEFMAFLLDGLHEVLSLVLLGIW